MDFYSSISGYYDEIFPLNPAQVRFIESYFESPFHNINILDAGCGTGVLALELTRMGFNVHAIDYEARMIDNAKNKKKLLNLSGSPIFDEADMRSISRKFIPGSFHAVLSFGNTVVHLLEDDDVKAFIDGTKRILKENGLFFIQILNYDYIINNKIDRLPVIENDNVIFERFYYYNDDKYLDFVTRLTIKDDGRMFHHQIKLNPIRKDRIKEFLKQAGFRDIEFFGDFSGALPGEGTFPLIVAAKK